MQYTCNIGLNTGWPHTHMYGFSTPFTFVYETVLHSIRLWLLEIWVLWDVMVCQVNGFRHFKGSLCFHLQLLGHSCTVWFCQIKALKKFRNLSPSDTESHTRCLDPQQHYCKNLKSSNLLIQYCTWKLKMKKSMEVM